MVNNHKSKWPHCDFMRMAEEAGFTVCDLIIKIRNGPMVSTKWKEAHHARKRIAFGSFAATVTPANVSLLVQEKVAKG